MSGQAIGVGFRRRIYVSPMQMAGDLWRIVRSARAVLALSRRGRLPADFRERIMLAVTGVNRCRHCAWGHQFIARQVGVPNVEIAALLQQDLAGSPANQIPGLLYSIHWAETDGMPTTEAKSALEECYGSHVACQIETAAMLISAGNRFGNSFDFLLSRISSGRLGLLASER